MLFRLSVVGVVLLAVAVVAPHSPAHDISRDAAAPRTPTGDALAAAAASHRRKASKRHRVKQVGDATCSPEPVDRPTIEFDPIQAAVRGLELGVPFYICLSGFADDAPIEVSVVLPNGLLKHRSIRPDPIFGVQSWYFLAYPPDPVGSYQVVASQGSRMATGTFTLKLPVRPNFETLDLRVRTGKHVAFVLAGFDPREKVALFLYRRIGYDARRAEVIYRRERHSVRSIRADRNGFALGRVTARRRGEYYLAAGGLRASSSYTVHAASRSLRATAASHRRKTPKRRRTAGIGDSPCQFHDTPPPVVDVDVIRADATGSGFQLGVPFHLCFSGFSASEPIDARVLLPDGTLRRKAIVLDPAFANDVGMWLFLAFPPNPLGVYRVEARQSDRHASTTFTIHSPTQPSLDTLRSEIRERASMPIVLAGFAPREKVHVYLYRKVGVEERDGYDAPLTVYARGSRPVRAMRVDRRGFARSNVVVRRRGLYLLGAGDVSSSAFAVSRRAASR